jgi:hypothetical protein
MSWVSADTMFNAIDERSESEEAIYRRRRMEAIAAAAKLSRPEHIIDVVPYVRDYRERYRAECSCGWAVIKPQLDAAVQEAEWHA